MQFQISGKQIDVGEALRNRVEDGLSAVVGKYAKRATDAHVTFSREGHEFACEIIVHLSTGLTAQAHGHEHEIHAAFVQASERMDKQLRRYKRRLKDHHRSRTTPVELSDASSYILAASEAGQDSEAEQEQEPQSLQPIIVAEMEAKIPSLSVGEAVMQMELAGAPVLVFRNEGHSGLNVVYRREDGNIGWVDPRSAE